MQKKVIITGASGFVGGYLVSKGLELGYEVFASIRKSSNLQYLQDDRIKFLYLDLSSSASMAADFKKIKETHGPIDHFIHNAGATFATKDNATFYKVNETYTGYLTEAIESSDILKKKLLYVSSMGAQGPGNPNGTTIKVTDQPNPVTVYGDSKLKGELKIQASGLDYNIIRPPSIFGPRDKRFLSLVKLIQNGVSVFLGSKDQKLSFIDVRDLSSVVYLLLEKGDYRTTYLTSEPTAYSSGQFYEMIKKVFQKKTLNIVVPKSVIKMVAHLLAGASKPFGRKPMLNPNKVEELTALNWDLDVSPLLEDTGYTFEYPLPRGIIDLIDWYRTEDLI